MNILIIPSWYPSKMDPNGVPFIRAQAQALSRAGHNVTVVFTQAYSLKTVKKQKRLMFGKRTNTINGVKEILTYFPKTHIKRVDEVTRLFQGKRILKKLVKNGYSPDVVHVHTFLAGELGVWFHNRYHVPLVATEHYTGFARNIVKKWEMKRARKLYTYSSLNLAVSGAFAKLLKDKTGADFDVLPNMVNTEKFKLSEKKDGQVFQYLFVGSLHDKKNPLMLLNSFIELYKKDKNIRLVLAGEGELTGKLKSIVKSHGLDEVVSFPGFINSDQVSKLMSESHAFILPSKFETFGIVVIEALASGLPVIVTRSGGPESFVLEGKNGFIIDQDQNQLTDSMAKIKTNIWIKEDLHNYVLDNFSEKAVVKRLTERYKSIIDSRDVIQASREISVSGGISKVAYQIGLQLTKLGHNVTTYTADVEDLDTSKIGRVVILPMPKWVNRHPGYLKNYIKTKLFTKKVHSIYKHKNNNPKAVTISHRDSYGANIAVGHSCHREAIEIKKREGRKFWWLNPIHPFYLNEERRIFRKPYPELAAISTAIAQEYENHYKQPKSKNHIIPNGVDTVRFNDHNKHQERVDIINEFNLTKDAYILLFVGNEFKRKGLDFIIDAISLIEDNSNVHLMVLGGADKTPYISKIEKLNLTKNIHFTGRRADTPKFFAGSNLFILPANYEPFGLVGIEALSSGTPILAPYLGGFMDYLEDGKNGYFIKREAEDIKNKIELLRSNPDNFSKMCKYSRESALKYTWDNIGKQYSDLINKI